MIFICKIKVKSVSRCCDSFFYNKFI